MEHQDIRELRVAEVAHEEWPILGPDDTVESAIKLFAEARISGAPVVDDGGRLLGILTEGDLIFQDADVKAPGFLDILGGMIPLGNTEEYRHEVLKSAGVTADEVMTDDPVTVDPDATLAECATLMAEERKKMLPVVDNGRLIGIITEGDLIFQDADVKAPGFLDILGGLIPLGNWDEYRKEALKSAGVTVDELMTRELITISPDATLAEASTIMAEKRVKILPVAEEDILRGVITRMDILTLHVLNPRR